MSASPGVKVPSVANVSPWAPQIVFLTGMGDQPHREVNAQVSGSPQNLVRAQGVQLVQSVVDDDVGAHDLSVEEGPGNIEYDVRRREPLNRWSAGSVFRTLKSRDRDLCGVMASKSVVDGVRLVRIP